MAESDEAIRELAYKKWQEAGCPTGDGVEFWLQAEAEIKAKTDCGTADGCGENEDEG